jgi:hypothetical protein
MSEATAFEEEKRELILEKNRLLDILTKITISTSTAEESPKVKN